MLVISESDVVKLVGPDRALACVRQTMALWGEGGGGLSDPRSLFLRPGGSGTRYHVKGGYLSGASVAGIRVNGIPEARADGSATQMIFLSELSSAEPLALVASEGLNALRVGATLALTITLLRAAKAKTLALIGAGRLARATATAIQLSTPFDTILIASRSADSARKACTELSDAGVANLEATADLEQACAGADVIVTVTGADAPLIQARWCRPGSLLVTAGSHRECEDKAILQSDKIFVDDWEQCTILGDLAALHRAGRITQSDISGTLSEVVAGRHAGREAEFERIVAVPQGMTVLDVALGHLVYRSALEQGLGTTLLWP